MDEVVGSIPTGSTTNPFHPHPQRSSDFHKIPSFLGFVSTGLPVCVLTPTTRGGNCGGSRLIHAIKGAIRREKPYKLFDERGLFTASYPKGARWWRLKFRVEGKEKLLSLGVYPDVVTKGRATAPRRAAPAVGEWC